MNSTSENFSVFVPLLKVNEEQRLVYGVMAEEVLDNSGEIFDYDSSKPNFEKWSEDAYTTSDGKSKGNLRVMHGSVAAGKLTDISFDDQAKRIECCAKVVDDNEWKKVLEGVYTGFSIGGRYEKRWAEKTDNGQATRYTAKPVEVSLVDKPCIPTATFQMIKADGVVEDRLFKTVIGEDEMNLEYTPTNDELLPVARELAKAANGDDAAWVDFMDAAREELIAKAAEKKPKEEEKPLTGEERKEALEGDAGSDEKSSDASEKEEEEEMTEKSDDMDEETQTKTSEKQKKEEEEDTYAAKSETPELKQVWQTSDGQTFSKKAEAVEHEKSLGAEPSLTDLIKAAKGKLSGEEADKAYKADEEGEYGDVEYADPGYQAGGKPRYPIDTEQHIRAAWNYIHQEKNAAEYDAKQVKQIKNRIIAAWKDKIDEQGPPSAEKMDAFGDMEKVHSFVTSEDYMAKGLWEVSRMATVLQDVACIQSCLQSEANWEGDNSPVPNKLKDAVASLGTVMVEMVSEEVGELVASMANKEEKAEAGQMASPVMALAASSLGLEKADADDLFKSMIAGKTMYRIQKMHDHTVALGAMCKSESHPEGKLSEEAVITEKMAKFETISEENELLKADLNGAKSEIAEAKELIKSLMADMDKIKAMPMPSAPRTHVVDKTGDVEKADSSMPDLTKMSKEQLADLAIRMAQSQGNPMLNR